MRIWMRLPRPRKFIASSVSFFFLVLVTIESTRGDSLTDVFFFETFDSSPTVLASRWSGAPIVTDANGSGSALKIVNSSVQNTYLKAVLSSAQVAGRRVVIRGRVKESGVSAKPAWYNGSKILLVYHYADGTSGASTQANLPAGTFDWTNVAFPVTVPANVTAVWVEVGLEAVSGTAWFDDVRVDADPTVFVENFDDGAVSSRWSGTFGTLYHGTGSAVSISNTNAAATAGITTSLPVAALNGHRVVITAQVKASSVSTPPGGSTAAVAMRLICVTADGQTIVRQALIDPGTYDWTTTYAVAALPQNVVSAQLFLGLDRLTGAVYFDSVRIDACPILLGDNFDDAGAAGRWSGSFSIVPHGAGNALQITNTNTNTGTYATLPLPFAAMRGQRVILQANVEGSGLSAKPNSWNGVKVMVIYTESSGSGGNPQLTIGTGTFDWTTFRVVIDVPADVTSATLKLGVELVSGTATFDEVQVKILDSSSPYWTNPTPGYVGHAAPRLRGTMVGTQVVPSDLAVLQGWGANLIRWQLGGADYSDGLDTANYATVLAAERAKLDANLSALQAGGTSVTLDLHSLSEYEFESEENQKLLIDTWKQMAAVYKHGGRSPNADTVWAYDIANEPIEPLDDGTFDEELLTWNELAEQVTLAIRCIDANKAIVIESTNWADPSAFPLLRPVRAGNIVYSLHCYDPHQFTHQQVLSEFPTAYTYPGIIAGKSWDLATLQANVQPAIDFQNAYQVSIYVGEFSAARWAPGAAQYLADAISIFEAQRWDWSYHAFRESGVWDLEIPNTPMSPQPARNAPTVSTDRRTVVQNGFSGILTNP